MCIKCMLVCVVRFFAYFVIYCLCLIYLQHCFIFRRWFDGRLCFIGYHSHHTVLPSSEPVLTLALTSVLCTNLFFRKAEFCSHVYVGWYIVSLIVSHDIWHLSDLHCLFCSGNVAVFLRQLHMHCGCQSWLNTRALFSCIYYKWIFWICCPSV